MMGANGGLEFLSSLALEKGNKVEMVMALKVSKGNSEFIFVVVIV